MVDGSTPRKGSGQDPSTTLENDSPELVFTVYRSDLSPVVRRHDGGEEREKEVDYVSLLRCNLSGTPGFRTNAHPTDDSVRYSLYIPTAQTR